MITHRTVFVAAALLAAVVVAPTVAVSASVTTTGFVAAGEGTIGHGSIQPAPAPFDAVTGVNLGTHPASAYIVGVYTLLCSRDVFNTSTGAEAALGTHGGAFCGTGVAGPDMNALGVSGTVFYSFRDLALDYNDPFDFTFDLSTNVESRIYRGGQIEFYYSAPGDTGDPTPFARSTDLVLMISIDWDTLEIVQTVLGSTPDTGPGMLALLVGMNGVSDTPVQQSGVTSEGAPYTGAYGAYNDDGSTWVFTEGPVANEESTWGAVKNAFR